MRFLHLGALIGGAWAACNGQDAFCSRRYSDITVVGSHNSAFDGVLPAHNQFVSVTEQLNLGVRFLQAQTQSKGGVIEMCHTYCWELDVGPLTEYLAEVTAWIEDHPDEVVTLLLTNKDALPITQFDEDFETAGLKPFVYRPERDVISQDEWPTLQELIDAGTRLVVFMDANSDQDQVDYILDQFSYFWETPYGITDEDFPTCEVDRPDGADTTKLMGIMNHMLNYKILGITIPNMFKAADTNSHESIQKQVDLCIDEHGIQPHVVLLDWINVGDAIDVQLALNGM
jgi:hypothetical protein